MIGLRSKLLLGFAGMLLIVLTVSVLAQTVMEHYSRAIQKSYREDYESVAACQAMKEAVERLDRSAQDALWDRPPDAATVGAARAEFERQLAAQREEATLPGEAAATDELARRWAEYDQAFPRVLAPDLSAGERRALYVAQLTPRSEQVRAAAQQLIRMNLDSILSVPRKAQQSARQAHWAMRLLTVSGVAIAVLFAAWIGRMILRPIRALTDSVHEIERGNLDLSVAVHAHDELGALANAFNNMAVNLRRYRQIAQDRLVRTEQTTQLAIDSLPDAVLVITPERKVELANVAARKLLGVMPGDDLAGGANPGLLADLLDRIADAEHATELSDYQSILQVDQDGQTRFFLPRTAPILDAARRTLGATVVLADVTGLRRLDEMKNSLLSLVSHELKTPLTAARMVLHLVTDRKIGPLTDKQADLLQAAREDVDRLFRIVESLLDMSRIESGRALMEFEPIAADELVRRSIEPLAGMFQDVELRTAVPPDLPQVFADPLRIGHVFANLLMNALRHTPAGGRVAIEASRRGGSVEFLVRDTGSGIPRQYLHRLFEKFFRVPCQNNAGGGSGLGLAIAKEIVESHHGHVRIDSTEGAGTTVAFTLLVCTAGSEDHAACSTSGVGVSF
ncbi:MAG TPA: ATP-binding protein [Tepidisphaeraceae bacterium]|jgi:signal transduction histidine kinase